ncbi:Uma2 family endonuclease [Streptomyces sp. NPDC101225]|uniref:Uma2 family endonuclease n=1 Tax=Streptomyces sp. NPDC101225 TaxID=3366135 RepID=UPI003819F5DF
MPQGRAPRRRCLEEAVTADLPDWLTPPRPSGWEADDLDHLPQAPRHTELIDGALISTTAYDPDRTWYAPEDVSLVVEVVSEESADRDRSLKPFKYGQAKTAHFWRVEDEAGAPVVHTYELDSMTSSYVPTGIHRGRLKISVPFPLDIDLDVLVP